MVEQLFFVLLTAGCVLASGETTAEKTSNHAHFGSTFVFTAVALALFLLALLVAISYYCRQKAENVLETATIDEIFPDMKPAFESCDSKISEFSSMDMNLENLVGSPLSPTPTSPVHQMLSVRQGSVAILAELNDGFPIDLSDWEAEEIQWDDYGNVRERMHSVIFAEESDCDEEISKNADEDDSSSTNSTSRRGSKSEHNKIDHEFLDS